MYKSIFSKIQDSLSVTQTDLFCFKVTTLEQATGLPHTQGNQGTQGILKYRKSLENSRNFQFIENLRKTQGILIYRKLRKT